MDLITRKGEPAPRVGERTLLRHPFEESKRANVVPAKVEPLLFEVWDGPSGFCAALATPDESRAFAASQIAMMRGDIMRSANPTPYKVSVTDGLRTFLKELWESNQPIPDLC